MAAYLIGKITITDPAIYDEYRKQVPDVVAKYGGRFLVRGGAVTPLEGNPGSQRIVVLEFADPTALRRFYDSDEYAPLIKLRQSASTGDLLMVEGVA